MTRRKKKHSENVKKTKMSSGTIMVLVFLGGLLLYGGVVALSSDNTGSQIPTEDLEGFAKCLIESDATFYGTEWCSFCAQQKQVLGDVYNQFRTQFYVDCDRNQERCSQAGVRAYPTWVINGQPYQGVQSIDALSNAMNCQL